jgi:glycosyltransferase involved in cell wall biosynthesis
MEHPSLTLPARWVVDDCNHSLSDYHYLTRNFSASRLNKLLPPHFRHRPVVVLETRVVRGSGGGPDKTILNTPRFLRSAGYDTLCAYMHPPGDPGFEQLQRKAQRWQAPLLSIADCGPLDWKVIPQLLNLCRRKKVAIWHGHDYKSNLLGLILRRFWPMKLVTTVHGWVHHTSRTPLYYAIDRFCLPRYERVLCVSEDLRQRALECRVPPKRCLLIENAIDTDEFRRDSRATTTRNELGLNSDAFLIGAVGRLSAEKGFDLLLRALAQLRASGIDAHVLLVGEGEEREALETLAVTLGCRPAMHLAGFHTDIRPLYEAMDLFALSSLREGLPNVLLEAMAMQVPVLATRIAGVPKVIDDGQNGVLVNPGSVEELTQGLLRMHQDEPLRRRLAEQARKTVEERYTWAGRMQRIAAIYDELLERSVTPS